MPLRPPTPDDAEGVLDVLTARDIVDLGAPDFTLEDLLEDWAATEVALARDAVVAVDDEGAIVAYAFTRKRGTLAAVHPEREGEGWGAKLLAWAEARAEEMGAARHVQWGAAANSRARALLQGAGYVHVRSYWRMMIELGGQVGAPLVPEGVDLRALDPVGDSVAVHALDEAAFSSSGDYRETTLAEYREEHLGAHDLAPELSVVAERDGQVVGFLLARHWEEDNAGYVDILAVAPKVQGQGLGGALLLHAFRGFSAAGLREASLGVASDNPRGLRLYERAGMRQRFQIDVYERPVAPGAGGSEDALSAPLESPPAAGD